MDGKLHLYHDFREYLSSLGLSRLSINLYVGKVHKFSQWLHDTGGMLDTPTRTDLLEFKQYLFRSMTHQTVNSYMVSLHHFIFFLLKNGCESISLEEADVALRHSKIEQAFKPKGYDHTQILRIRRAADMLKEKKYVAALELALTCGLRISEICGLRIKDIDIKERVGWLNIVGKGNKQRKVPISKRARLAITEYLEEKQGYRYDNEYLFSKALSKRHYSRSAIWEWFKKIGRIAEIENLTPHALRHTYITTLVRSGNVDLVIAQRLAGHSDIKTTIGYSQPNQGDLERAVEDL